jgi:hypothetical protein
MKTSCFTVRAIACAAIAAGISTAGAAAGGNPFVGDWKLDPSRSKLTDVMKVRRLRPDQYTFNFAAGSSETIVIDGTDQPGISGTTLAVGVARPDAWTVVRKKDGRVVIRARWELSKDGNTLTDNFSQFAPDGSSSAIDYVYRRKGAGSGFAGTWVSTSEVVRVAYVLQIRPYEGDGLSFANSASQFTRQMKLDGKDYPNTGATAAVVPVSSVRRLDGKTLQLTDKDGNGNVYDTQQVRLSADGAALTLTIRTVGREEPNILVFARQ